MSQDNVKLRTTTSTMSKRKGDFRSPRTAFCSSLIDDGIWDVKILMDKSLASQASVYRLRREKKCPSKKAAAKKGRRFSLSTQNQEVLRLLVKDWPLANNAQLAKKLAESGGPLVSRWTIGRHLDAMGFARKTPRSGPLLTAIHKKRRLTWCHRHKDTDWSRVVFSDESCFQLFGNKIRQKVLCSKGTKRPRYSRPGKSPSLMVWGGISLRGQTPLAFIDRTVDGTIDSLKYQQILEGFLFPTMDTLYPSGTVYPLLETGNKGFVLQQDNAPCHVSRSTKKFFVDRDIEVLDWPPCSPDLNPIENLWGWMKKELAPLEKPTLSEMRVKIEEMWSSLDHDFIKKYIDSMPRRIKACIKARGGHTKY